MAFKFRQYIKIAGKNVWDRKGSKLELWDFLAFLYFFLSAGITFPRFCDYKIEERSLNRHRFWASSSSTGCVVCRLSSFCLLNFGLELLFPSCSCHWGRSQISVRLHLGSDPPPRSMAWWGAHAIDKLELEPNQFNFSWRRSHDHNSPGDLFYCRAAAQRCPRDDPAVLRVTGPHRGPTPKHPGRGKTKQLKYYSDFR